MDKSFDPYYKWLGIPPHDQPPHHYRLLGIEVFESDRDVIDAAANRVMSYLKDLAVADEAQYSQKLLNEVSRARLCLLNPQKKAAYDAELQGQRAARSGARPMVAGDLASSEGASSLPVQPAPPPDQPVPPPDQPSPPPALPPLLGNGTPPPVTIKVAESPHRVGRHGKRAKRERPVTLLVGPSRRLLALSGVLIGLGVLALLLLMFRLAAQAPVVDPRVPSSGDQASGLSQPPVRKPPVNRGAGDLPDATDVAGPGIEPVHRVDLPEPSGELPGPGELSPDGDQDIPPHDSAEPAEPTEPEAIGRPPAGEPDDRPPSGLPERADFVDPTADDVPGEEGDPTAAPERIPSEAKPPTTVPEAEVPPPPGDRDVDREPDQPADGDVDTEPDQPADPESESPPEPTLDFRYPFADLPPSVALPAFDDDQLPAPFRLGPVYLREPAECSIELVGGERVTRRSYQFRLAAVEGQAQWDFVLERGDTEARIAQLTIEEDQQLRFAWHSAASEFESAPLLANCVLRLSGPPDAQHSLALRIPNSDKHLAIDWERGSTRAEFAIPHLPDARSVFLEIVGLEGAEIDLDPPPRLHADDGQVTLPLLGDDAPLALDLQLQSRRTLQLTVTPWLLLPPEEKPNLRDQRPFTTKLKERIQFFQTGTQQLERELANLPRNLPAPRHQVEQEYRQRIELAKKVVEQLEQLQRRLTDPDHELGLQLRVFFEAADGTPVELLHRGIGERPDEEREPDEP